MKFTEQLATIFYIVNSVSFTGLPTLLIALVYCFAAYSLSNSLLAPVMTIFPFLNMRAVVLVGSLSLMMRAANRFGLYYAFLQ